MDEYVRCCSRFSGTPRVVKKVSNMDSPGRTGTAAGVAAAL
jgi:hypothetical protein